jgi:hypothetical protein
MVRVCAARVASGGDMSGRLFQSATYFAISAVELSDKRDAISWKWMTND